MWFCHALEEVLGEAMAFLRTMSCVTPAWYAKRHTSGCVASLELEFLIRDACGIFHLHEIVHLIDMHALEFMANELCLDCIG